MHYNPVNDKYKIILHTKNLTQEELMDCCSTLKIAKEFTVEFFNPYEGEMTTIKCYRGDRKVTMKWDRTDTGILFEPFDIHLVEL